MSVHGPEPGTCARTGVLPVRDAPVRVALTGTAAVLEDSSGPPRPQDTQSTATATAAEHPQRGDDTCHLIPRKETR